MLTPDGEGEAAPDGKGRWLQTERALMPRDGEGADPVGRGQKKARKAGKLAVAASCGLLIAERIMRNMLMPGKRMKSLPVFRLWPPQQAFFIDKGRFFEVFG
jgi:hypothetical protein